MIKTNIDNLTVPRKITVIIFISYLLILIYLTLFSQYFGRIYFHKSINLKPFDTINRYITYSVSLRIVLINLAGNIIAFIPFGFLLPLIRKSQKQFLPVLCYLFSASISIEIIQYILGVGVSDIDDVILNMAGGILGYSIYMIYKRIRMALQ